MWEKLNRMCMMIMNKAILEAFRAYMSKKINTSKEFLAETEKKVFQERKGKIDMLLTNLISIRYNNKDKGKKRKKDKEVEDTAL